MSSLNEFLNKLNDLDVKLWLEDAKDTDSSQKFRLKYNAPKGTMNPDLVSEVKKHQTDIIQFLQQANQSKDITHQSIQPTPKNTDLPLSFAQERLWFLEQLEESGSTYNCGRILRLQGSLDIQALEASINEIVRRHQVLRTAFVEIDGTPIQKICEPQLIKIQVLDLQNLPAEAKLEKAWSLASEAQNEPFDLLSGLLIRVGLIQLEPEEHLLLVTLHDITADRWSMSIFWQELTSLYQAFCEDKPSPLPELPIQYGDFAYWQRQHYFQGETLQKLVDYWKQQLAGVPPLLELPTDRPRPPRQTFSGRTESILVDKNLYNKLKTLTKELGVTLFMTLLSAFAILLYRYSGQSDIVIGSPVAKRNRSEVQGLIGFLVNSLALRVKITADITFTELLTQVKKVALDAYEHQDLPFEKLVEELQLEPNLSYSPVFQTRFVLQNSSKGKSELPELNITELEPKNVVAKFDLSLEMVEVEQGLAASFEYNTDLFDAATIKRMTGHFQTLLEGIVNDPSQKVDRLPLITIGEKQQILYEWNDEPIVYHLCIHQLFETQAKRTPNAIAVKFEQQELTYQELNTRTNQLAHYLQELGIEAETKVGIALKRSPELIIAVLAILKTGGAYVPLDPNDPRLEWILSDSQVKVLLTTEELQKKIPENQAKLVCLDTQKEKIAIYPQTNPENSVKPQNIAYIIYTSGSTGKPKGVMIEHHSLASFSCSAIAEYQINSQDRILQFASLSFDIAAAEIYPFLITGATVVLKTEEMLNSLSTLIARCREWKITVLNLPTTYWHQLTFELVSNNLTLPESVRLVIFGGEAASPETVRIWLETVGEDPQLINAYGSTETTVEATTYKITITPNDGSPLQNQQIPIGKPIANAEVYILDKHLQPVPIGIPGEIYIGGTGVARGYWNQPELTQQKFIVGIFPGNSPQDKRLYKTGDLGKYLPDGNIQYLGLIDNQIKIRGFRIELGQIESLLNQHSHVQQGVVIAREDVPGDKRLVAYVVLKQNQTFTNKEMTSFLKEKLPNYMIPSALVILETFPLTPNDQIDRASLPKPDYSLQDRNTDFVAPSNPIETKLAAIWKEILKVENISIHDNFFELGGHSLLATQLRSRIRQNLSVEISLGTLFESPTIAALAEKMIITDTEVELNYWKEKLGGTLPILELPTDYPRPQVQTYNGGNLFFELPKDLSQGITSLSQQLEVTPFMTLLTTFNILLHRYSNQEDIIIGSAIPGRNHLETEGFNTLALRTQFTENQSFQQLLAQVKKTFLEAYVHQTVPFEKVVEAIQPERDWTRSPIFQVMFVLQNTQAQNADLELENLTINPIHFNTTAKFDLTLFVFETAAGYKGIFEYNTDLFTTTTIETIVGHFQTLLEGILTNPETKIVELPLITSPEAQQIIDCNNAHQEDDSHLTPEPIAVKSNNQQLTDSELNQKTNQPADYLPTPEVKADEQSANILPQKQTVNTSSSLVSIQTKGNKKPLFCVHSGYGEILLYQNLALRLDPDRPVYGLVAKGEDENITDVTSIEAMATHYVKEIKAFQPQGPYLISGVCIGGTIAIEMARQLKAQGENVPLVVVFGTAPLDFSESPSHQSQPFTKSPTIQEKLTSYGDFLQQLSLSEKILHLADKTYEKIDYGLYLLKKFIEPYKYEVYRKLEKPLSQDLQRFHLYLMNNQAQDNFEQKVFDGKLLSFWASLDKEFSLPGQMSWTNVVTEEVKIYDLPQVNIKRALNSPDIQNIADTLRQELDAAEADNNQQQPKSKISQFPQAKSWSSLIPIQPKGNKPPLFCIHGSEGVNCGEPLYGYDLARNLDSNQPIYGLRAVGLDGKTNPLNTIEVIASKYLAEIQDVHPSGQYLLLGLDIGGLIALEMAQQLLKQGEKVPLLAIINAVNTNSLAKSPTNFLPQIAQLKQSIKTLQQNTRIKFIRNYKEDHLANDLRYFAIQQSLIQAQKKYQPKVYQNNLTIFSNSKSISTIPTSINWKKIKSKNHKIHQIQGNITNIFKIPNIEDLSSKIQACINDSLSDKS